MRKESFEQIFARKSADDISNAQRLGELQVDLVKLRREFEAELDHTKEQNRHFKRYGSFTLNLPKK